jgi:hypothetical protein
MRFRDRSKHALVVVLIACLLRALLPIEGDLTLGPGRSPAERSSLEDLAYPCAGHACGCRTREHCLTACCCFSMRTANEATRPIARDLGQARVAELAPRSDSSERSERTAFVQALKCAGGAPHSVAASAPILSIEPCAVAWHTLDDSTRARARVDIEVPSGLRPNPGTPPPRA